MALFLKEPKQEDETLIYYITRINGKMFKYSTGLKVEPKHWDFVKKRFTKSVAHYSTKNLKLKNIEAEVTSQLWEYSKSGGQPDLEELRNILDEKLGKNPKSVQLKKAVETMTFEELWLNEWIPQLSVTSAESTINKKHYALNCLTAFSKETKYNLTFENINERFSIQFKKWALNQKKQNGLPRFNRDNSINKYLSITKEFAKWAYKNGFTNDVSYSKISNCNETYYVPFALENEDIKKLNSIDFKQVDLTKYDIQTNSIDFTIKKLEEARDSFIFRCFCGIRFSDYKKLTSDKIINNRLTLVTQKTGTTISLPLSSLAIEVLVRNNFNPPKMENQKENEVLKLLALIAGFTEKTTVTYKLGGVKKEEVKKRWELVTTHTARKTFITNCLRAGIEPYLVMEMVGIKKESTFKRYVQVSNNDMLDAVKKLDVYISKI